MDFSTPEFLPLLSPAEESKLPFLRARIFTGITSDSRNVKTGFIFVVQKGIQADGVNFIKDAKKNGATLIVGEHYADQPEIEPLIDLHVKDARQALGILSSLFFDHPSRKLKVIGVTGTSGKTTTSYLLESILKEAGEKVGVIGTVNFRYADVVLPSTHTTPGAPELQALLLDMLNAGVTAVIIEVSSHALNQKRVDGISFDGMVFTNLTPEHLDFHPTMQDYFESKSRLFTELALAARAAGKSPELVIHRDDPWGEKLTTLSKSTVSSFGFEARNDYSPDPQSKTPMKASLSGIHGEMEGHVFHLPLLGDFNILNALGAIAITHRLGVSPQTIARGLSHLQRVPGRLEKVLTSQPIHILVDYAHKPDALEKVLSSMRSTVEKGGRLICLFGCGGDRDRSKRPTMGRIACELSDHVWITSDNPRTEDPNLIIQEILTGTRGSTNFSVDADRRSAIFAAVTSLRPKDVLIIAGKGHEDYQILGTQKIFFDDRIVAQEALQAIELENQYSKNFFYRRFTVVGLGKTGLSIARFLAAKGSTVFINDKNESKEDHLKNHAVAELFRDYPDLVWDLGQSDSKVLKESDVLVLSPGVPPQLAFLKNIEKNNIEKVNEIELAMREIARHEKLRAPIIGVTGTSGKTTTVTLIGAILEAAGKTCFLGGNIGAPLIDYVQSSEKENFVKKDFIVVELSSFQLEGVDQARFDVGAMTSFHLDHLDRYENVEDYFQTKKKLLDRVHESGTWVLPFESPRLQTLVSSRPSPLPRTVWISSEQTLFNFKDFKLPGTHNIENILTAYACVAPFGDFKEATQRVINNFKGLPHRIEFVRELRGVRFYNDSKATNAIGLRKALETFPDNSIHLIAGGKEKGIDYHSLLPIVQAKCLSLNLIGQAKETFKKTFSPLSTKSPILEFNTLKDAVVSAFENAKHSQIVLLSPGCASQDMFRDFEERGSIFKKVVLEL